MVAMIELFSSSGKSLSASFMDSSLSRSSKRGFHGYLNIIESKVKKGGAMSDRFEKAEEIITEYQDWIRFSNRRVEGNELYLNDLYERTEAALVECARPVSDQKDEKWRHIFCSSLYRQANDLLYTLAKAEMGKAEKQVA